MDTMNKHIVYSKTLIHDNNFSIADQMIKLSVEVQIALHTCKVLQENWDKTLALILKVHFEFLSYIGVFVQIILNKPLALFSKRGRNKVYKRKKMYRWRNRIYRRNKVHNIDSMYIYLLCTLYGGESWKVKKRRVYTYKDKFWKISKNSIPIPSQYHTVMYISSGW